VENPQDAVAELSRRLRRQFGDELVALYLFGSLAAGGFHPGRSDLDLLAVLDTAVDDAALPALEALHAEFVTERPEWRDRVEVGYVSRAVLRTLGELPAGHVAAISPGEPLNIKEAGAAWTLDWHSVCEHGQALAGPAPLELGPAVTPAAYRKAVESLLAAWPAEVRAPWVAYVPAHQGYVVVTVCRALHVLATGTQTSKEDAARWAAERHPAWAAFIEQALRQYRADVRGPHEETIRFVDEAVAEAGLDPRPTS
jgi:predicted nucleotidyltransferase